jgi:glycosyltransferase involved in cell wall biosynthesis
VRFGYFGGPDHRMKGLPTLLTAADRLDCGGFELRLHVDVPPGRGDRRLPDRVGCTVTVPLTVADRVRVLPPFPPAALGAVLGALDCLVVPSLMRESYSLVTREALAAGVPVIASDSGGPGEVLVPERNGLLFATGDADDLAACVRRIVLEPGLADTLRAGARATVLPTIEDQARQLEGVYASLRRGSATAEPRPAAAELGPVLFVAGCDGAPYRYRVTALRDTLATHGIASHALWWSDRDLPAAIAAADTVVVYRVPMSPWLAACVDYAQRLGRRVVFSCDDLLFDPTATPHAALAALPENQRAWWIAATARYAETLRASDAFLGATEPLVAAAARLGVPGFVVRNGLGARALAAVERLRKHPPPRREGEVVLVYLSGTTMHDLDVATIAPVLARVLAARPAVRLRLGGHVVTAPALAPWHDRIERLPFLPWPDLFAELARADVQLAPLRLDDPFSDAKSEVKYLEAGALGVPTVASPTDAFRRAIVSGRNGMLADGAADWEDALLRLVDDPGLRARLGAAAHRDVFLHATPEMRATSLLAGLATVRGRARPGAASRPAAPDPARYAEVGGSELEPDDLALGTAVEASDTPTGFLLPGRSVGQRFAPSADGLMRIDVRVGTDGRPGRRRLTVHLADAPGAADLRRVVVDAAPADAAWVAAVFPPLDARGRDLYVWLECEETVAEDAVTLWTYARGHGDVPPGGLHLDHRPAPGSLTFRTFYRAQ